MGLAHAGYDPNFDSMTKREILSVYRKTSNGFILRLKPQTNSTDAQSLTGSLKYKLIQKKIMMRDRDRNVVLIKLFELQKSASA